MFLEKNLILMLIESAAVLRDSVSLRSKKFVSEKNKTLVYRKLRNDTEFTESFWHNNGI